MSPISEPPQIPGSPPREPFKRPDPDAEPVTPVETQVKTQFFDSESSPIKPRKNLENLDDIRRLPEATDNSVDDHFTRDHLSDIPFPPDTWWDEDCSALASTIRTSKKKLEIEMYPLMCKLMNCISERIHASLEPTSRPPNAIIFLDHHKNPPNRHPQRGVQTNPDILAVSGPSTAYTICKDTTSVYEGVPWHRIISCVEPKTSLKPRVQLASYLWDHMTARPDMPGVYGLAARAAGYEIMWSDASGTIASPLFTWDSDCGPLARYIYSLYVPPPNHITRDPSIQSIDGDDPTAAPLWTIRVRGKVYPKCRLLFFGPSWGRRTFVWGSRIDGEMTVIKDAHRDDGRRFCEGQLLTEIHSSGYLPGVVRLVDWGFVSVDRKVITTAPRCKSDAPTRRRVRLVLGSFGMKLGESKSVLDLLKAIYDVIEVHRFLSVERNIMHRDMSLYNVRMYPKHHMRGQKKLTDKKPMFIDEVLGVATDLKADNSRCLLIDWDNSSGPTTYVPSRSDHDPTNEEEEEAADTSDNASASGSTKQGSLAAQDSMKELATRTGTPTYIARSVAAGKPITNDVFATFFSPMPTLQGKAKTFYLKAYGQAVYDSFTDKDGTFHGGTSTGVIQESFLHRPRHDIESVFWTLLSSLLRVSPKDAAPETNTPGDLSIALKRLDTHVIHSHEPDNRGTLLTWTQTAFENALHPNLASLAPMCAGMCAQIRPEYAYLSPSPRREHLHEAMRRLLLRQIVDMGEDAIRLDPLVVRVPKVDGRPAQAQRLSKRLFDTVDVFGTVEDTGIGEKRQKRKA